MKQDWFHGLICWLIAQYLRLVFATSRWDIRGFGLVEKYLQDGAVIPVTWHNRIAISAFAWNLKKHSLTVLASGHRDGRLVTRSMSLLGVNGVSIPPKQSGAGAARQVVKLLKAGDSVVITPDGPRGPRYHMKEGVVAIAKMAKVPMVMVTYNTSRRKLLKSWDRFILPLPFSQGIIAFKQAPEMPLDIDAAGLEGYRANFERELIKFTDEIDMEMGFDPIEPATDKEIEKALKGKTG